MSKKSQKTILEKAGFKSFSQGIREITGWSQKEFETQKRVMRMRVSNFNKLMGTELSPIEELFYKVKAEDRAKYYVSQGKPVYPPSPIQQALQDIKTTKIKGTPSTHQMEVARQYVFQKFEGLSNTYQKADNVMNDMLTGKISPQDANKKLTGIANEMKKLRSENVTTWASLQDEDYGS